MRFVAAIAVFIILLVGFLLWRRPPAALPPVTPSPSPSARVPDPVATIPSLPTAPPAARDRFELEAFLDAAGRAVLIQDRRKLDALFARPILIYIEDMPWVMEQASGRDTFRVLGAIEVLGRYQRVESVPVLKSLLLGAPSVFVRDAAAVALGRMGGVSAEEALLAALASDIDASVRAHVAQALAHHPSPSVFQSLASVMRGDSDPWVRRAAAEAMAKMPYDDNEKFKIYLERFTEEEDRSLAAKLAFLAFLAGGDASLKVLSDQVKDRPDLQDVINEEVKLAGEGRYLKAYPPEWFQPGRPLEPTPVRRIGITVDLGDMTIAEFGALLFAAAPLDRYRESFYFRISAEFTEDLLKGVNIPRAYNASGQPLSGVPRSSLDGAVVLHVKDPSSFEPGMLGYTKGVEAFVTKVSLLHEMGHALADLGDEYSHEKASVGASANVAAEVSPWGNLTTQGHLPKGPFKRSPPGGWVPSDNCHMNNRKEDDRFCPVCQLEMIAKICEKTDARVPW